jgi:hypothetical protein
LIVCDVVERAPWSSTTWRRTLWSPAWSNDARATGPLASSLPSPSRSQRVVSIVPSESVDVDSNVMVWPTRGAAGVKVKLAAGLASLAGRGFGGWGNDGGGGSGGVAGGGGGSLGGLGWWCGLGGGAGAGLGGGGGGVGSGLGFGGRCGLGGRCGCPDG